MTAKPNPEQVFAALRLNMTKKTKRGAADPFRAFELLNQGSSSLGNCG